MDLLKRRSRSRSLVLLVRRQHHQDAVGHHLAVEVMVLLRGGQDGEAVIHSVSHAGGVVHLNEVGDKAGGDDDGLDDLRQLRGNAVPAAILHGLPAPADDEPAHMLLRAMPMASE